MNRYNGTNTRNYEGLMWYFGEYTPQVVPDYGYCTNYEYADPNNDDGVVDWGGIDIIPGECISIVPSWGYERDPYGDIGDLNLKHQVFLFVLNG